MEGTKEITEKEAKLNNNPLQFLEKDSEELINKISELVKKVENGDSAAMVEFGRFYMEGKYFEKSEQKAVELFKKAAEKGNLDAIASLWFCYEDGLGVDESEKEADIYFKQAVDICDADSLYKLIILYENNSIKNETRTNILYEKVFYFGNSYLYGINGVKQNKSIGIEFLKMAAKKGNSEAMVKLGYFYMKGKYLEEDEKKAIALFEKAAGRGDLDAILILWICYENGFGVEKNEKEADIYFKWAVNMCDADFLYNLINLYEKNNSVKKDIIKTIRLYEKAFYFGNSYLYGINGVERDEAKGIKLLKIAAENGNDKAIVELGYCCHYGYGNIEQNLEKAVEFYKIATRYNNSEAMVRLGYCYQYGYGVKECLEETTRLYKKAANLGNEKAKFRLESMQGKEAADLGSKEAKIILENMQGKKIKDKKINNEFEDYEIKNPTTTQKFSKTSNTTNFVKGKKEFFEKIAEQQQKSRQEDKQSQGIDGK